MLWTVMVTAIQVALVLCSAGAIALVWLSIDAMLTDRRAEREAEQEKRMVDCILHVDEQSHRLGKSSVPLTPSQKFGRLLALIRQDPKLSRLSDADRLRMVDAQLQRLRT